MPPRGRIGCGLFNAIRYVVKSGIQWRMMPHDFPPWDAVYQQAKRWLKAGVFEAIAHDLRIIERVLKQRDEKPSAVVLDARTIQSTPESGPRAGYDGHKKTARKCIAVDTLRNLLSIAVMAANEQERNQISELAEAVKNVRGGTVELAYVDQGYTGQSDEEQAADHGIKLEVVKHTEAKHVFVLLVPRGWVVERTFGWLGRFRCLAHDYERLKDTLAGYHWVASLTLLLGRIIN